MSVLIPTEITCGCSLHHLECVGAAYRASIPQTQRESVPLQIPTAPPPWAPQLATASRTPQEVSLRSPPLRGVPHALRGPGGCGPLAELPRRAWAPLPSALLPLLYLRVLGAPPHPCHQLS